ncbi:MAG: hypothetical protein Fur0016_10990 [Anaerolineales bacterium]
MTTKILVSLPQEFLDEVDQLAAEEHRSRSELIREALRAYLEARQVRKLQLKRIVEQQTSNGDLSGEVKAWEAIGDEALKSVENKL